MSKQPASERTNSPLVDNVDPFLVRLDRRTWPTILRALEECGDTYDSWDPNVPDRARRLHVALEQLGRDTLFGTIKGFVFEVCINGTWYDLEMRLKAHDLPWRRDKERAEPTESETQ